MRTLRLTIAVFAVLALALPASAQQQEQPPAAPPQGAAPAAGAPNCVHRVTPPEQRLYNRFMRRLAPASLTPQQDSQIQSYVAAYSQQHPAGSPLDPASMQVLRREVMALLTPEQRQAMRQYREQHQPPGGGAPAAAPRPPC